MVKERTSVVISVLIICVFLAGCTSDRFGSGSFTTGSAAKELVNYVNQGILRIEELEKRSLESYASVTGENYTTDERAYEELKDVVIPIYKRFLDGLKSINPENEDIKRVHGIYIRGAESMYDGFKTKMLGIENKNEPIKIQGNEKIVYGREEIERWQLELEALCKEQGVALAWIEEE
ncbi:hypothetical protein OAC89_01910 [Deltaproteobacteria bacterium]|nr:hypothetical protein [Deltaproteobacteria bacterium]